MTWLKLDDGFDTHPKVVGLTDGAFRLHVAAMCYCARHLTDGEIPAAILASLHHRTPRKFAAELVTSTLWISTQNGYKIDSFNRYNPTRSKVLAEREAAAQRQQKARLKADLSRRDSRRDNTRDFGGSHGPPDPTRPQSLSETAETDPSARCRTERDGLVDNPWSEHEAIDDGRYGLTLVAAPLTSGDDTVNDATDDAPLDVFDVTGSRSAHLTPTESSTR
jgi:hypothetical protein